MVGRGRGGAASVAPRAGGGTASQPPEALPEEVRRRLIEAHLLHPRRYLTTCGIPSVALEELSFKPGFALWQCCRGPSWVNTACCSSPRCASWGIEAERIVQSLVSAVERYGYRESYNPLTGRGLAARGFGFATLLVDLLAQSGVQGYELSATQRMIHP